MDEVADRNCRFCGKRATQCCALCKVAFYCSRECQKKSWKSHKSQCHPFLVKTHPIYGRYLIATREIKAGEIILKEPPLVVGPKQCSSPVCLGCHVKISEVKTLCKNCGYPLCSERCEKSKFHEAECRVLSKSTGLLNFSNNHGHPNHAYDCITPLRCVLLKLSESQKWKELLTMQSNEQQMRETSLYIVNQRNVVDFIRIFLGYKDVDDDHIYRVCGILNCNSFELLHNGSKVQGVYVLASLMAHSCCPNTKHTFDRDHNIIFRAMQPIAKGEAIFNTYTQLYWDTLTRRAHLKISKFFSCECKRCLDPTELGTNLGSLLCSKCGKDVQSTNPMDSEAEWKCVSCGHTLLSKQIKFGNEVLNNEIRMRGKTDSKSLEDFLHHYDEALHPNHRFMVQVKVALIMMYGNNPKYRYRDLTEIQLRNKMGWCKQILVIAGTIESGKSLLRGKILLELQATLVALAKFLVSNDVINEEQAKVKEDYTTEAADYLQEASELLRHEPKYEEGDLEAKLRWLAQEIEL